MYITDPVERAKFWWSVEYGRAKAIAHAEAEKRRRQEAEREESEDGGEGK